MTGQIPEKVIYKGKEYRITGISGEGLFTPVDFGITVQMMHTACYRGYASTYKIVEGELILHKWTLNPVEYNKALRKLKNDHKTKRKLMRKNFSDIAIEFLGYPFFIIYIAYLKVAKPSNFYSFPRPPSIYHMGYFAYKFVDVKSNFTGGLLIGRDFHHDFYVHMGFQKPHTYGELIELLFEDGKLTDVFDHSEKAAEIRQRMKEARENRDENEPYSMPDRESMIRRIEHQFSLEYRAWWG